MAVTTARLNRVGKKVADKKGVLGIVKDFLGDCTAKDFYVAISAERALRNFPEHEHIRISILGLDARSAKASWTVSPNDIVNGAHVYVVGRGMLRRLGHLQPHRNVRLTNVITKQLLRQGKHLWNPNWPLPRVRLGCKASQLSHTLKIRFRG